MATLLEMKNLAPTGNIPVAAQHGALPVAQPGLTQTQIAALQPLENAMGYLGVNRETLEGLRTTHSTRRNGFFADSYFKRGTPAHHRAQAKELRTGKHFAHHITSISADGTPTVPLKDIAKTHEAIANRIDEVKAAHEALLRSHPNLAKKDRSSLSSGRKLNRKYKIPSGAWQSIGPYHGNKGAFGDDGTPKTFEKGGRKRTRKTRRRKRKRKTKRKTRRRKRKRKTRKRKTRKRKTRKHRR